MDNTELNIINSTVRNDDCCRYTKITQNYVVGESKIAGYGIIAKHQYKSGDEIDIISISMNSGNIITPYFGRYVNHSYNPSTIVKSKKYDDITTYYLYACKNININDEITCDYNKFSEISHYIKKADPSYL
jgi:SET domain-containing protein